MPSYKSASVRNKVALAKALSRRFCSKAVAQSDAEQLRSCSFNGLHWLGSSPMFIREQKSSLVCRNSHSAVSSGRRHE